MSLTLKALISTLIFLLTTGAFAETLILEHQGKSIQIPFIVTQGLLVNDKCEQNLEKCEAIRVYQSVQKGDAKLKTVKDEKVFSNPAAVFCKKLSGTPLRLHDDKNNEWSICAFKDKSMADSWGLMKAQKKAEKK